MENEMNETNEVVNEDVTTTDVTEENNSDSKVSVGGILVLAGLTAVTIVGAIKVGEAIGSVAYKGGKRVVGWVKNTFEKKDSKSEEVLTGTVEETKSGNFEEGSRVIKI